MSFDSSSFLNIVSLFFDSLNKEKERESERERQRERERERGREISKERGTVLPLSFNSSSLVNIVSLFFHSLKIDEGLSSKIGDGKKLSGANFKL